MEETVKYIWNIVISLMIAIMAYFFKKTIDGIDSANEGVTQQELSLQKFRTEASETYAKDSSVQQSLSRLHDRIDDIGTDIKTILIEIGRK